MTRVSYQELDAVFRSVLIQIGFTVNRAESCAKLFAEATCDGVYSHGLNRFPRFIEMIRLGVIDINAQPELEKSSGALEQWNGNSGPGNLNAQTCMSRAIELAQQHGIGCVALANTNHWMRGGSYGWQAAEAGFAGICWTNTLPNLPPWGSDERRLGNNPLVVAVPREAGHVVLDMATSQFSYGALESYRMRSEQLPVFGGYDSKGELTRDPAAIEASGRPLPIGFWKGSGLSLMLDLVAVALSGGLATHQIPADSLKETALSQVFIAMAVPSANRARLIDQIVEFTCDARAIRDKVRYPGERTLQIRKQNLAQGIPVDSAIWETVLEMLNKTEKSKLV
jgi:3-dehydro-L-gulonate 2-dehydrogenase